jgi:enoyl-CoA hydratase/carnithine racemase
MIDPEFIIFEKNDQTATITLQREETNLLNITMLEEINLALSSLSDGRNIRALIIKATGNVFCGGLDFAEHGPVEMEKLIHTYHKMYRLLDRIECPTVSLVQGAALGAGCELACFCDMVLASDEAKFGLPEIKIGLFPQVAAIDFPRYGQIKRINELILVGDSIDPEEAKLIGLISHVYPLIEFEARSKEIIYRLTSNSSVTLRLAKRAIKAGLDNNFSDALKESEAIYLRDMMATDEAKAGLASFIDKQADL